MGTETPNFALYKPAEGENGWAQEVNDNFETIDTELADERIEDLVNSLLSAGASINLTYDDDANDALTIAVDETTIDHDSLSNFVDDEHVNHANVNISTGAGLTGGGDITTSQTVNAQNVTTETSGYTAGEVDVVLADASSGGFTVTLPIPSRDVRVNVKKIDNSSNTVTIATPGSETIDGQSSLTISGQYVARSIVSDGSDYYIV